MNTRTFLAWAMRSHALLISIGIFLSLLSFGQSYDCAYFHKGPVVGGTNAYPIKTIYVNVHFIQDEYGAQNFRAPGINDPNGIMDGVSAAQAMINEFNLKLANMPNPTCPNQDGVIPPNTKDARIRLALYTETSNSSDTYNGVWFHTFQPVGSVTQFQDLDGYDSHSDLKAFYGAYGNNVFDIFHVAAPNQAHLGGSSCFGSTCASMGMGKWYSRVIGGFDLKKIYELTLHEFCHTLDVEHTDASQYCPDFDQVVENSTGNNCNNAGNQSGQFNSLAFLTQCQISKIHTYVESNTPNHIDFQAYGPCDKNPVPMEIKANTTWAFKTIINSDIIIKSGTRLTITCEIQMAPGTGIIVEDNKGHLFLNGGKITSSCPDQRWIGIVVQGDKSKLPISSKQGIVNITNGSEIENASIGIRNWYWDLGWQYGGRINVVNSTFKNNYISAYIGLGPMAVDADQKISFKNTEFLTDDDYVWGSIGPQVILNKVKGVKFERCNFRHDRTNFDDVSTSKTEEFDDDRQLGVAISSIGSNFKLSSSYNPEARNPGVIDSEFEGFYEAVRATSSTTPYNYEIIGIKFKENVKGIVSRGVNNFVVKYCDLEVGNLCVDDLISHKTNYHEGIAVQAGNSFDLSHNEFINLATNPASPFCYQRGTIALRVSDVGGLYTEVSNNKFTGFEDYANRAEGLCRSLTNAMDALEYKCNDQDLSKYDVTLFKTQNADGIKSWQGRPDKPAGNLFTKNIAPVGSDYANGMDWDVTYFYYAGTPANPADARLQPENNIGDIVAFGTNQSVDPTNCSSPGHRNLSLNNDMEWSDYDRASLYTEKSSLLSLMPDPELNTSWNHNNIQHRRLAELTALIGWIDREYINEKLSVDFIDWNSIITRYTLMDGMYPLMRLADIYLHLGDNSSLNSVLNAISQIQLSVPSLQAQKQEFILLKQNQRDDGYGHIALEQTSPYLSLLMQLEGGRGLASVQAESELEGLNHMYYWPPELINQQQFKQGWINNEISLFDLTISPNPANQTINIQLDKGSSLVEVRVLDVFGKLRYQRVCESSVKKLAVNISSWESGVYIVEIRDVEKNRTLLKKFIKA